MHRLINAINGIYRMYLLASARAVELAVHGRGRALCFVGIIMASHIRRMAVLEDIGFEISGVKRWYSIRK